MATKGYKTDIKRPLHLTRVEQASAYFNRRRGREPFVDLNAAALPPADNTDSLLLEDGTPLLTETDQPFVLEQGT